MLYLSRRTGPNSYEVVDTDDGVETSVVEESLDRMVLDTGLRIEGVVLGSDGSFVDGYLLYQDPRYMSPAMAKLKVLRGIDLRVYKGELVAVYVDYSIAKKNMVVNVSDYASSIASHLDSSWDGTSHDLVTLVLDESVQVVGGYLHVYPDSFRYDVRKRISGIWGLYSALEDVALSKWANCVIDNEERFTYYYFNRFLTSNTSMSDFEWSFVGKYPQRPEVLKRIEKQHIEIWSFIANLDKDYIRLYYRDKKSVREYVDSIVPRWKNLNSRSFDTLKEENIKVFNLLSALSATSQKELMTFRNYIVYFNASAEVKKLFVALCHNTRKLIRKIT